jgi:hypothetical protein
MPKKLPKILNPKEIREEAERKMTFSEKYEEELKRQLFEEDNNPQEVIEASDILLAETTVHKERSGEKWDVPLSEEVQYFDPELSYEITGYRPITMEKGLDFDPTPFCEAGRIYDRTGKYTEYPPGGKKYNEFWNREYDRCTNGLTIGKYRITGDHYFFLNYYRMDVINEKAVAGAGRKESFPGFLSKQYEFFHYVEMAEKLHKDICILKARGIGLSEIVASLSVRPYTTNRGYNVLLTCAADAKLTPLKNKCWKNLDWLNTNTGGGMRHVRLAVNNVDCKRASIKTPDGTEKGWMSQINSVVADTADKIRGDRIDRLIFEEAGSNKILTDSWIKADALVALGGFHFGSRIALGTGGDSMALEGLKTIFLNPRGYNVLPFKNYDTDDSKPEIVSFFIPAHKFALTSEYLDKRGVTDHVRFKKFYEEQRAKLSDKDYLTECAEHCFTPREALSNHGDNVFDANAIAERIVQIKTNTNYTKPKKMHLLWTDSTMTKVDAKESPSGDLLVVEPPILDPTGKPYKNLYVAGIDSIDMGREDSATDNDVSDFCIVVKKRVFGTDDPKYVAMYKARPNNIRTAYDVAMKLLVWYNCKAILEYTKISIQTYFKDKGKGNLFMQRPDFAAASSNVRKRRATKVLIGVPGTEAVIRHELELISNFLCDYWYTIDYEEILDQLLNYSYENKRKFDIVAALGMAEVGDEAMSGLDPVISKASTSSNWKDFGWYVDEKGYKRRGVIPKNENRWS